MVYLYSYFLIFEKKEENELLNRFYI